MTASFEVKAHWKRMREDARACHEKNGEMPAGHYCAFCMLYNTKDMPEEVVCQGCPICKKTGLAGCAKTPYNEANNAWVEYHDSDWDESQREWWELKADAMIAFLEAL